MVAQFPVVVPIPTKNQTPSISIDLKTVNSVSGILRNNDGTPVQGQPPQTIEKFCYAIIEVKNIQKSLAVATFSRVFDYVKLLAIAGVNPKLADQEESETTLSIDLTEPEAVCYLMLKINKLNLNQMNQYFSDTLTYLTSAIAVDLNPEA